MKLVLKTDFVDSYDDYFDVLDEPEPHINFHRFTRTNISRENSFKKLLSMNEPVVPHGYLRDLSEQFFSAEKFVVYTDTYSHSGKGKELIDRSKIDRYSDLFSSLYLGEEVSVSYKKIVIGNKVFWSKYKSTHSWKSNVGDVETLSKVKETTPIKNDNFPIYTIDYVSGAGFLWSIDLNLAPELKNLCLPLNPKEIHSEIYDWYERLYYG